MINGLGVLGWGVGGIEAEAAMLGEAVSMLVPQVVGFRLTGELPEGATATDLVLTVTRDPPPDRRGREVRRVLRTRHRRAAGGRSRDDREHVARIRRDLRILPCRRADPRLSAADRAGAPSASRSSRPTARRTCSGTTRRSSRRTRRSSSSTSATSSRVWPARAGLRTACRYAMRSPPSFAARELRASPTKGTTRRSPRPFPRVTRPSGRRREPRSRARPPRRSRWRSRNATASPSAAPTTRSSTARS